MKEFRNALSAFLLEDLGFKGSWFTLERGRLVYSNIRERLDRRDANFAWWDRFPSFSLKHLPHLISDHRGQKRHLCTKLTALDMMN